MLSCARKRNGETLIFDESISDWGSGEFFVFIAPLFQPLSHTLTHAHTHTTHTHTHTHTHYTHTHTTHTHTHYTHTPEAGSPRIVTGVASQLSNLSLTSVTSTDTEHSTLSAQEETHAPKQQHKSCACCSNSCSFPGLQFWN